jgi:hypothetical protein
MKNEKARESTYERWKNSTKEKMIEEDMWEIKNEKWKKLMTSMRCREVAKSGNANEK